MRPAEMLQRLSPEDAWAFADSNVLQAIARGQPAKFGRRGALLRIVVGVLSRIGLASVAIGAVGLGRLIALLRLQGRPAGQRLCPSDFFVGFGAGSEEALYDAHVRETSTGVGRLVQGDPATFGIWHRVGFPAAARWLLARARSARIAILNSPAELSGWRSDFIASAAIRVGEYAFARAWFGELQSRCSSRCEVAFLAADSLAFAAVDAGLSTRYLQHGLVRHSLVLPRFERITALTPDERSHFRRRVPASHVEMRDAGPTVSTGAMVCEVLVASVYAPAEEMRRVEPILAWASAQGLAIRVRPHPREDGPYWQEARQRFRVILEDKDASMHAALARLRPRLVLSWYSTALADALAAGVLPVTVCALDDPNVQDMVYPLFSRCLRWPDEQGTIAAVMNDDDVYRRELARLRLGWDAVPI